MHFVSFFLPSSRLFILASSKMMIDRRFTLKPCEPFRLSTNNRDFPVLVMSQPQHTQPTSATQAKDRLYGQLARSLGRMSGTIGKTADLLELLQVDLDAMKRLGGLHAAQ